MRNRINVMVWISLKLLRIHVFFKNMAFFTVKKNVSQGLKDLLKSVFLLYKRVLSTDFYFCSPEGTVMERIQAQYGVPTGHIQRENTYRGFLRKA